MRLSLFIILLLFLSSCLTIFYKQPQPKGIKNSDIFPKNITGNYVIKNKNDTLRITNNFIEFNTTHSKSIPVNAMDTIKGIIIKGDKIFDREIDSLKGINFSKKNDTIFYDYVKHDRIYLSDTVVLKKYMNNYFLNLKFKENAYWNVYLIEHAANDSFEIFSLSEFNYDEGPGNDSSTVEGKSNTAIDNPTDKEFILNTINKITKCKKLEADQYMIDPSKRKLMKMIKELKKKGILNSNNEIIKQK